MDGNNQGKDGIMMEMDETKLKKQFAEAVRKRAKSVRLNKPKLMKDGTAKIPRVRGPEYHGCVGTGKRPVMRRSVYHGEYLVGTEDAITQVAVALCFGKVREDLGNKRVIRDYRAVTREGEVIREKVRGGPVYRYKTKAPALRKFCEMCAEVMLFNVQTVEKEGLLKVEAQKGNLEAIIALSLDYGDMCAGMNCNITMENLS